MKTFTSLILLVCCFEIASAQNTYGIESKGGLEGPFLVPSITEQLQEGSAIFSKNDFREAPPKTKHANKVVPGKGNNTPDPLAGSQNTFREQGSMQPSRQPSLIFNADTSPQFGVTDPTGAIGPNHYVAAWNVGFRVFDRNGVPQTPEMSLSTLFPNNESGDPIVFFDAAADNGVGQPKGRFVITQFVSPNTSSAQGLPLGFEVAVCRGPDPVNDGWYVYRSTDFGTGQFPDYTKFSVWGNAYYVTANISGSTNRVYAIERNEMLLGNAAQFVGFPLPGIDIATGGFYSPQAFHVTDDQLPPDNVPATIVFHQDDAWSNVNTTDHLKLWNAIVDWSAPSDPNATFITSPTELPVAAFIGTFDGGSFSNRPQGGGTDIDVLQATIMNQAQYRRFATHNSAVFNFVVDVNNPSEKAAVRWYELRQPSDNQPWTIYQEGTYEAPDGRDAYSASMAMDADGNIGMGYTSSSATDRISIRTTGRYADDPLNFMTLSEQLIAQSTEANPTSRLADYVHLTVDPVEQNTFWHIAEFLNPQKIDVVGKFTLAPPVMNDAGILGIIAPESGLLGANEDITVTVANVGTNSLTDIPVSYSINGGNAVNEVATGTFAPNESIDYTFAATADLSIEGQTYTISARTNLSGDNNTTNDTFVKTVENGIQYCETPSDCSFDDGLTKFVLGSIFNDNIPCDTGYDNFSSLSTDLDVGSQSSFVATVQTGEANGTDERAYFWIDFNDDGDFNDPGEEVVSNFVLTELYTDIDIPFSIPDNVPLGNHRLRTRAGDSNFNDGAPVGSPCGSPQYSRTADYTVNIIDSTLSVPEFSFDDAELVVLSQDNNLFDISLVTSFDGTASITVYNITGNTLVFNNIDKEGDRYNYALDMSYAASGVYIIQFGSEKNHSFKTAKIVVD